MGNCGIATLAFPASTHSLQYPISRGMSNAIMIRCAGRYSRPPSISGTSVLKQEKHRIGMGAGFAVDWYRRRFGSFGSFGGFVGFSVEVGAVQLWFSVGIGVAGTSCGGCFCFCVGLRLGRGGLDGPCFSGLMV